MANPRASIFADSDLDVSGFSPKSGADQYAPPADKVRAVAEEARFHSREPKLSSATEQKRVPRRHRTGRNIQFNVKTSQATLDAFYAITDRQGWVLGETLEHALAALQRELDSDNGAGAQ